VNGQEATELLAWAERAQLDHVRGMQAMRALRADQVQDLCRACLIAHGGKTEPQLLVDTIKRRRSDATGGSR